MSSIPLYLQKTQMDRQFKKRTYQGFSEFLADLRFLFSNIRKFGKMKLISPDFRERLMLAVTGVYGCRYCSYLHAREALRSGVDREEMASLLSGNVRNCPEEEATALIYAQHWVDSNADPELESIQRLVETYGSEKAEAINVVLRVNRIGNLFGNSLDCLLYRISHGRWEG